ncbi:nSTAND1 domain-containing NTPase [Crossiella sp. CA198]|uniref:nSTAND1 domain-containing NTPase n=1 Tax=Crossiella sp. CA198 TaxID=3455607 RepID=UPI003F8D795A
MPRTEQPLGSGDDPLTGFARDLRALRTAAGSPTYRELARRSHYSATTLADAAGGKRLPSLAATLAFVRACAGDAGEWESRWHRVAAELAQPDEEAEKPPPVETDAPYVGLAAFQATDADRFFGRAEIVGQLIHRLALRRFLAVFGASGAGKSSLLRAGLIATVRKGENPPPVLLMSPGRQPVEECAVQLAALTGESAAVLRAEFGRGAEHLHLRVRQALADREGVDLLVVVDQFEEVFTLCADPAERELFLAMLLHAASAPTSRVRVVLGARTDFYTHCAAHAELVEAIQDGQVLLGPMTTEQLREAITRPAMDRGYRLENALVATVMAETAGQLGVLPLVSHALLETWRRRHGTTLTSVGYQAAGGIAHAIARTAEGTYAGFDQAQQTVARHLFLRLTALGEGTEDTKRRLYHRELDEHPDTAHVVAELVSARLVTADQDGLEISHEALIRYWPRLHDWLAADREGLRTHRLLTEATDTWESLDRDPAALYRGVRLAQASAWAAGGGEAMTVREREFLTAAEQAREEEAAGQRRRTRRLRQLVAAVVAFAILASTTAIVAFQQRATAERQRDDASFRHVLAEADRLAASDPSLSAQLNLAAHRLRPQDQSVHTRLVGTRNTPLAESLTGHVGEVFQADFSRDGKMLATTGDDGTVRLWDFRDPANVRPWGPPLEGHSGLLGTVVFSPDGKLLAAAGAEGRVRLWRLTDPAAPVLVTSWLVAPEGKERVNIAAFHPDGQVLATGQDSGTVRLWDLTDPARPRPLGSPRQGADGEVWALAFSSDRRTVVSAGGDGPVRLWELTGGELRGPRNLTGASDSVYTAAFTPDGQTLVAGSRDSSLRLWRVADGSPLFNLVSGHNGAVWQVAFNREGTIMATAGGDGLAVLWNVANPTAVTSIGPPLAGTGGTIYSLAFSPDGRTVATGAGDGTVRLWALPAAVLIGHQEPMDSVVVSQDGRVTVTGAKDQKIRIWSTVEGEPVRTVAELPAVNTPRKCQDCPTQLRLAKGGRLLATLSNTSLLRLWDLTRPDDPVLLHEFTLGTAFTGGITLSPDGRAMATNETDQTSRLWDISDPRNPRKMGTLDGHEREVMVLAYRSDGRLLVTSGLDRTVQLWDVSDPANPVRRGRFTMPGPVDRLAISPDGRTLALSYREDAIVLWSIADPANPRQLSTLSGHTKQITAMTFSPDGGTLASTSNDSTMRLWRVSDPASPSAIGGPISTGNNAGSVLAFRADDRHLVVGDGTNIARLLELDVTKAVDRICASTGQLTEQQWQRHLLDLPRRPTC